jgi:hypothetical protein
MDPGEFKDISLYWCASGCGINSQLTAVEAGFRFIRQGFQCSLCRTRYSRYFDILAAGYVLVPRPLAHPQRLIQSGQYRGQVKCNLDDGPGFRYTTPSDWPECWDPR